MKDQLEKYTAWLKYHEKYTAKQVLEQVVADIKNSSQQYPINKEDIETLVSYFGESRSVSDSNLDKLDQLDVIWRKVYNENRIKLGFGNAATLARRSVIKSILTPAAWE